MNQSSFEVVEFGTAQNGKAFALVSMRTPGVAKRVVRAVNAGESIDGRAVDGIGETYVGRGGRPVARVYFAAVAEAPVAPRYVPEIFGSIVAEVEAAPVVVHEFTIRAFAIVSIANAVQLSLFGGAL